MSKSITTYIFFLGIMVFVTAVSVLTLFSQSIRLDESQSLWVATKPLLALLNFTAHDVATPLYLVILHIWVLFLGTNIVYSRILSLFFLLASLVVLFAVAKEVSDTRVAIVTILLFTLSPFVIWYSNEARMYTLLTLITSCNHMFFLRFMKSHGEQGKMGYLFSTIAGFYTHYFFVFLILAQCCYVLWQSIQHIYAKRREHISFMQQIKNNSLALLYFKLVSIAALCFTPWIIFVISLGGAANTQPLLPTPSTYTIFQTFVTFIFGFQSPSLQSLIISLWPLFVVTFFFIFTQRNRMHAEYISYFVMVTFLPILFIYLGSYIRPIFLSRYLIFTTPTLFFLIAWITMGYSKKISAILLGIFFIGTVSLVLYQNISTSTPVKENYAGVAAYLNTHATASDIIAVSAPFTIYPIEYSYTGDAKIVTIPEWNRYVTGAIPPFTMQKFIQQLQKYQTIYGYLYVVLSYDQGYQKNIVQYLQTHYAKVESHTFSPGLEVIKYKLRYD